jgi:hypothetical protein
LIGRKPKEFETADAFAPDDVRRFELVEIWVTNYFI